MDILAEPFPVRAVPARLVRPVPAVRTPPVDASTGLRPRVLGPP